MSLLQYQNVLNGGKCGVCGDPWGKPNPQFVAGGKYANGIITRTYKEGQVRPKNHTFIFENRFSLLILMEHFLVFLYKQTGTRTVSFLRIYYICLKVKNKCFLSFIAITRTMRQYTSSSSNIECEFTVPSQGKNKNLKNVIKIKTKLFFTITCGTANILPSQIWFTDAQQLII